jgi:hypothetical protein
MVRSASSRVSNHEARSVASSFETRLAPFLRMKVDGLNHRTAVTDQADVL